MGQYGRQRAIRVALMMLIGSGAMGADQPTGEAYSARSVVLAILQDEPGVYGGYQAIMWNQQQGVYYGASASRQNGHPAGF